MGPFGRGYHRREISLPDGRQAFLYETLASERWTELIREPTLRDYNLKRLPSGRIVPLSKDELEEKKESHGRQVAELTKRVQARRKI